MGKLSKFPRNRSFPRIADGYYPTEVRRYRR
jgi:hypothetical protein